MRTRTVARFLMTVLMIAVSSRIEAGLNSWTSTGPRGENITSAAVAFSDSNVIYVGTASGTNGSAFKSVDGGTTWVSLALPQGSPWRPDIPIVFGVSPNDPNTVWVSSPGALSSSSDGGATWKSKFSLYTPINVVALQSSGAVWIGSPDGLERSTDGGLFLNPGNFPLYRNVTAVVFDPSDPSIVYACADHLYRSPDDGESWQELDDSLVGAPALSVAIDPSDSSKLYLGRPDGLYRSTNGGMSWEGPATGTVGLSIASIAIDPATTSVLDAADPGSGLLSSTDSGVSWAPNPALCPTSLSLTIIDPADHAHLITAGASGYFDSSDSGMSWSLVEPGPPALDTVAISLDPTDGSHVYAATAAAGLWASSDGGTTWDSLCDPVLDPRQLSIAVSPSSSATIYVGTETGVFKSVNGGANWTPAGMGGDAVSTLAVDPTDAATVYAGTRAGPDPGAFFRSTDGGSSWQPALDGVPPDAVAESIALDPSEPTTLYFGVKEQYGGTVLKSVDSGSHFSPTGLSDNDAIFSVIVDSTNPSTVYAGGGYSVYRSVDGGMTSDAIAPFGPTDDESIALDPSSDGTLYVASSTGTFKTNDGGATWRTWPGSTIPGSVIRGITVDPALPSRLYGSFARGGVGVVDQVAPTVSSVSPSIGNTVGGILATIHGTGFMPGLQVIFDGAPLAAVTVAGTEITIVTPPHPAGFVDVQVIDPTFLDVTLADAFEYTCSAPFTAIVQGKQSICPGGSADVEVYLSGVPPWTLNWHDGEADQTSESPFRRTVTPISDTTYYLDSISDSSGCGEGSPSGAAVITVSVPPPAPVITAPLTVPADATDIPASVAQHPGNDYFWTLGNATITGGWNTSAITFTPLLGAGTTVSIDVSEWDLSDTRCFSPHSDAHVQVDFLDVPPSNGFHDFVDALAEHGVTS